MPVVLAVPPLHATSTAAKIATAADSNVTREILMVDAKFHAGAGSPRSADSPSWRTPDD